MEIFLLNQHFLHRNPNLQSPPQESAEIPQLETIIKAPIILLELAVTNPGPIFFTGAKTTNYTCTAMVLLTTTVTEHSRGKPKLGLPSQQCKTPQVRFRQHTHEGATPRHQESLLLLLPRWSIFYRRLRHHRTKKHVATASKPSSSSSLFPFNPKKPKKCTKKSALHDGPQSLFVVVLKFFALSSSSSRNERPLERMPWRELRLIFSFLFVCLFGAHFRFPWNFGVFTANFLKYVDWRSSTRGMEPNLARDQRGK